MMVVGIESFRRINMTSPIVLVDEFKSNSRVSIDDILDNEVFEFSISKSRDKDSIIVLEFHCRDKYLDIDHSILYSDGKTYFGLHINPMIYNEDTKDYYNDETDDELRSEFLSHPDYWYLSLLIESPTGSGLYNESTIPLKYGYNIVYTPFELIDNQELEVCEVVILE